MNGRRRHLKGTAAFAAETKPTACGVSSKSRNSTCSGDNNCTERPKTRRQGLRDNNNNNSSRKTDVIPPGLVDCRRRRSTRCPEAAIAQLASYIVCDQKKVVVVTGAGLSVASGIRPFRRCRRRHHHPPPHHHINGGSPPIKRHDSTNNTNNNTNNMPEAHYSTATGSNSRNRNTGKKRQWDQVDEYLQTEGLWDEVLWTTATRAAFRKDPHKWYREFWIPKFGSSTTAVQYQPNRGHYTLDSLRREFQNVRQITQNIDGLQQQPQPHDVEQQQHPPPPQQQFIEVHGRVGLYKCCPDSDSDDSNEFDDDGDSDNEDRPVVLGHRGKSARQRALQLDQKNSNVVVSTTKTTCPYRYVESLTADQVVFHSSTGKQEKRQRQRSVSRTTIAEAAHSSSRLSRVERQGIGSSCNLAHQQPDAVPELPMIPHCPDCGNVVMPQALLFDECYHSHAFYQFEVVEDWLAAADILVFVGTSFAVNLTVTALHHARNAQLPVFNFNLDDVLSSSARLDVSNIVGSATETLPCLLEACRQLRDSDPRQPGKYKKQL